MQKDVLDVLIFSFSSCLSLWSLSLSFLSQMCHNKSVQFQNFGLGVTLGDIGILLILAGLVSELQKNVVIRDISLFGYIQSLFHTMVEYLYFS